jgi:hypothetical protein
MKSSRPVNENLIGNMVSEVTVRLVNLDCERQIYRPETQCIESKDHNFNFTIHPKRNFQYTKLIYQFVIANKSKINWFHQKPHTTLHC